MGQEGSGISTRFLEIEVSKLHFFLLTHAHDYQETKVVWF